ncbi:MAG: geranylgeranylglyceryl phosphate synthase family protein [Flavobacteriales bacterium]|jgi:putative glycerol-1-phosphate prenyltransferase|nr:geranylgeranylglyceryl phosphate synthase family protein [Flavobacteriales bacterium]
MIEFKKNKNELAILLDPGKLPLEEIFYIIDLGVEHHVDYFFVGGSLMMENNIEKILQYIRSKSSIPCILYPGSNSQIHPDFDALLFMSLVSGRNPEYLIGQQVVSAPIIKKMGLQAISTAYILIADSALTSVAYMSQTQPIPTAKYDIAIATAMASELLGFSTLFIDGGSGIEQIISAETLSKISGAVSLPIIVGGGVSSLNEVQSLWASGADIVVIGNAIEENPELIKTLSQR